MSYGNMGCQVLKRGVQDWKDILLTNQHPMGNSWILGGRKFGFILGYKVIQKLILSKNVKNKKCARKFKFFNENDWERFGWFLAWKSDFWKSN